MGHQDRELRETIEKLSGDQAAPRAVTLGVVFLRYLCAAFEEFRAKTRQDTKNAEPAPDGEGPRADPKTDPRTNPLASPPSNPTASPQTGPADPAAGRRARRPENKTWGRRKGRAGREGARETGDETEDGRGAGVFFVPESARWDRIFPPEGPAGDTGAGSPGGLGGPAGQGNPGNPDRVLAEAFRDLERENPGLRDLFPRDLARSPRRPPLPGGAEGRREGTPGGGEPLSLRDLGGLLRDLSAREAARLFKDLEEEFYLRPEPGFPGEGPPQDKGGGGPRRAPVPRGVVELAAHMLEPYQGRFFDPHCGSAEFLAGAADFVTHRQGKLFDLAFYAQERSQEAWRLARMNLIIRGIDTAGVLWNPDGPLRQDPHRDLKFDFVALCPPPADNPYHWISYALDRLSPTGLGALLLPKGSLSSSREGERDIRRTLVESRLVDCVVNLPPRICEVGSSIWFLSRAKTSRGRRTDELLFIDARRLGRALGRRRWEFSADDSNRIARTYHNWRFPKAAPYRDIRQFAVSVHMAQIREEGYNLNPAVYLGIPETEEDTGRGAHFAALRAEFEELVREEPRLSRQLTESLRKIRFED